MRVKLKKEGLHDINGNGRAYWFSAILNNGKSEMISITKSDMKNKTEVSGYVEFDIDDKELKSVKSLKDGEILKEISICQIVDVGDFSQDSMEIEKVSKSWEDAVKYAKRKYKIDHEDEKSGTIYVKEEVVRKVIEA